LENKTQTADLNSLRIDRSQKSNPGNKKRILSLVLKIFLGIISILLIYIAYQKLFESLPEVELTTVTLQTPAQSNAVLTASGYVVAQRKAAVASKGTGRLIFLGVVEGDHVIKDQVIAKLEDNDIKAQLDQANANLKLTESELIDAKNTYERQKELLAKGLTSKSDFESSEWRLNRVVASIELAKAQVRAAEVALENMLIRAPFNGTVLTKNADVGEIVAPLAAGANSKAAVVTIADMSSLQVEADVSESNIEKIFVNQPCQITLDAYPQAPYQGFVAKIVPTADRSKATVMVKVGFVNYDKRVLPEMSAKVLFLNKSDKAESEIEKPKLLVPKSAIAIRNGKQVVFSVKENLVEEKEISTGKELGDYIEVTCCLAEGETLINKPKDEIKNGIEIKIKSGE
jgi:RND family efflux transporter MFP subunit